MLDYITCRREIQIPCSMCQEGETEFEFHEPDSAIEFNFGYGSNNDGEGGITKFCPKCSDKIPEVLQTIFPEVKFITFSNWRDV